MSCHLIDSFIKWRVTVLVGISFKQYKASLNISVIKQDKYLENFDLRSCQFPETLEIYLILFLSGRFWIQYRWKRFGSVVLQFHSLSKIYHMSKVVDTPNPIQPISCSVSRIIRISVDQDSISSIFNFLTASQNNPLGQGRRLFTKNGSFRKVLRFLINQSVSKFQIRFYNQSSYNSLYFYCC